MRGLYFLGFVCLTSASIALLIWAGLQLRQATIDRTLGWRYVIYGAAALTIGNIVWRVFCELWIVLFNIHDRLVAIDEGVVVDTTENLPAASIPVTERVILNPDLESRVMERAPRTASILGLP